jgi:transcriptional regulator of arginine metabolism
MKYQRHAKILELIANHDLTTQEEIIELLRKEGFDSTQATVSRDIKELGLTKAADSNGNYKYIQPKPASSSSTTKHLLILNQAVVGMSSALHTVVIKTHAGMAQAAGAAIDHLVGGEILGSIGGDDTLLLICQSEENAQNIVLRLKNFLKIGAD